MLSKKNLLSLIKENLQEMAMTYDTPDRPSGDVERSLARGTTPLEKIPFPETGNPNQKFLELLASDRYKQVIQNIRRYTGYRGTLRPARNVREADMTLILMMGNAHKKIMEIEASHKEELENLAIELVINETKVPSELVEFNAKITGMQPIDTSDFNIQNQQQQQQIPQQAAQAEENLVADLEQFNLEKAKRRLINAMIQGASKKGHYMYHMVEQRLREITGSDELIGLYGIMMSINDTNYWQLSDEIIANMHDSVAGRVNLVRPNDEENQEEPENQEQSDNDEEGGDEGGNEGEGIESSDKTIIVARGINFPVLVHELIKGVMEFWGLHGQPEDKELAQRVMSEEDTLEKELWDLRLGPSIWERFRTQMPEHVLTEDEKKEIQNYLLVHIFKLPAREFLVLVKEVISGSERGKNLISEIVIGIEQMLANQDYEEAMDSFNEDLDNASEETTDDDLDDFLGQFGIHLGDNEPEDED
jgi:hypothetical protein